MRDRERVVGLEGLVELLDGRSVVAVRAQDDASGSRRDRRVRRRGNRKQVEPQPPNGREEPDCDPDAECDPPDRPLGNEREPDEEQRDGEHRDDRRVLRRAVVPGDTRGREGPLLQREPLRVDLQSVEQRPDAQVGHLLPRDPRVGRRNRRGYESRRAREGRGTGVERTPEREKPDFRLERGLETRDRVREDVRPHRPDCRPCRLARAVRLLGARVDLHDREARAEDDEGRERERNVSPQRVPLGVCAVRRPITGAGRLLLVVIAHGQKNAVVSPPTRPAA